MSDVKKCVKIGAEIFSDSINPTLSRPRNADVTSMKGNFLLLFSEHSLDDQTSMMLPEERILERDELIGNQVHHSQLLQADFHHSVPHLPA